jgi:putative alpha-1,2-mannosidase
LRADIGRYLFTALGFYPVNPAGDYMIGSPLFTKMTM